MIEQEVIVGRPPNFNLIASRFPYVRRAKGIIYTWGRTIFNPDGIRVGPDLLRHEAVHGERQGVSSSEIAEWWLRYLKEDQFRFEEEAHAHVAEYRYWLEHGSRPERRRALKEIAARLSGPLYGRLLDKHSARELLRTGRTNLIDG